MAKQERKKAKKFIVDMEMLPSNDLVFCDMFENANLFTHIIKAVIGKNEDVELIEPPLSQVAYKNPRLSAKKRTRLGTIRVDVQAEGKSKLYSIDMQNRYDEKIVLNRTLFYSFRIYTSQTVKEMRYDRLKPACVTFIMSEIQKGSSQSFDTHRFTVIDETTGIKYFDIMESYIVFVPVVIKNRHVLNDDLFIFSKFLAVSNQTDADEFEKSFGNNALGKELIRLYKKSAAKKDRLLGVVDYSYYFTEKEYERVKLIDDEKHAKEVLKLKEQALEAAKQTREAEKQVKKAEKKAQESAKRTQEAEKQAQEAEKQAQEAEKQALEAKKQTLEGAVNLVNTGIDIKIVSVSLKIPVSEIEESIQR